MRGGGSAGVIVHTQIVAFPYPSFSILNFSRMQECAIFNIILS